MIKVLIAYFKYNCYCYARSKDLAISHLGSEKMLAIVHMYVAKFLVLHDFTFYSCFSSLIVTLHTCTPQRFTKNKGYKGYLSMSLIT